MQQCRFGSLPGSPPRADDTMSSSPRHSDLPPQTITRSSSPMCSVSHHVWRPSGVTVGDRYPGRPLAGTRTGRQPEVQDRLAGGASVARPRRALQRGGRGKKSTPRWITGQPGPAGRGGCRDDWRTLWAVPAGRGPPMQRINTQRVPNTDVTGANTDTPRVIPSNRWSRSSVSCAVIIEISWRTTTVMLTRQAATECAAIRYVVFAFGHLFHVT